AFIEHQINHCKHDCKTRRQFFLWRLLDREYQYHGFWPWPAQCAAQHSSHLLRAFLLRRTADDFAPSHTIIGGPVAKSTYVADCFAMAVYSGMDLPPTPHMPDSDTDAPPVFITG